MFLCIIRYPWAQRERWVNFEGSALCYTILYYTIAVYNRLIPRLQYLTTNDWWFLSKFQMWYFGPTVRKILVATATATTTIEKRTSDFGGYWTTMPRSIGPPDRAQRNPSWSQKLYCSGEVRSQQVVSWYEPNPTWQRRVPITTLATTLPENGRLGYYSSRMRTAPPPPSTTTNSKMIGRHRLPAALLGHPPTPTTGTEIINEEGVKEHA